MLTFVVMFLKRQMAWVVFLALGSSVWGQSLPQAAWFETFEEGGPSWKTAGGDAVARVTFHDRVTEEPRSGQRCERISITADNGTCVYFCHEVGQASVIDELAPSIWIRSDRAGLQLFAEVVLPRSRDPRTNQPLSTLIPGPSYTGLGKWQQLRITELPRAVNRAARALRAQYGPTVDEREAYLVRLVVNVYGGPGVTNVWLDDLEIAGYVGRVAPAGLGADESERLFGATTTPSGASAAVGRGGLPKVELNGPVLSAEGRPIFPRMIRYCGEPLALLAQLGFQGVWMETPATVELMKEADRLKMWVVCPPPVAPEEKAAQGDRVTATPEIGPEYARVLAWNLGRGLFGQHLELTQRRTEQIRESCRQFTRPLVGLAESDLRSYSRYLNILLVGREPLGTSMELADYAVWLRNRPLLARPGTPIWTTVQTQYSPVWIRQLEGLDPSRPAPRTIPYEQLRLLVFTAMGAGSRGLLFEQTTPLSATDAATRTRAMALELINRELTMLEPWLAGGSLSGTITSTVPEVGGAVLRSDRARLLLPVWVGKGSQYVPGQSSAHSLAVTAPGVPESSLAYEIVPGMLRPLQKARSLGGLRVTVGEFDLADPILLSQYPLVIGEVHRLASAAGPRMAELQRLLAVAKLQAVEQTVRDLSRRVPAPKPTQDFMEKANESLRACNDLLGRRQYSEGYDAARRSMRAVRALERAYWETATAKLPSLVSSPASVAFASLPSHAALAERLNGAQFGPNLLPAGDFEDLATALRMGWRHFQHRAEGVTAAADVAAGSAHGGKFGLRLVVRPEDEKNPPAMLETAPIWITSPAVEVKAGDTICIRAWVRVPKALTSTVDGLLVFDSMGGEVLADRIGATAKWREVVYYRAAPEDGVCTVTFALCGLGEAWVDDVRIVIAKQR